MADLLDYSKDRAMNIKYACKQWILPSALLTLSAIAWGNALYIHAKASLAQLFIANAWQTSLKYSKPVKPWRWADTWPVARLISDKNNIDIYVLSGSSGSSLAFGPGHLDGTVLPGHPGASVIGGHRDTHFYFLKNIEKGDTLRVQNNAGKWLSYRVSSIEKADTRDGDLSIDDSQNKLILVTCFPFDSLISGGPMSYIFSVFLV